MIYKEDQDLKNRIENIFEKEIEKYPKALITYLQSGFDLIITIEKRKVLNLLLHY